MTTYKRTVSTTVEISDEDLLYFMRLSDIVASEGNKECVITELVELMASKNKGVHSEVITPDNFGSLQLSRGFRATLPDPHRPEDILDDVAIAGNPVHRLIQANTTLYTLDEDAKTHYGVTVYVEGYEDDLSATCEGTGSVSTDDHTFYKPAIHELVVKVLDAIKTGYITILDTDRKKYGLPKLPKK